MAEIELKRPNNNNLFIMFAPPDWTPMPQLYCISKLHLSRSVCGGGKWTQKMLSTSSTQPSVFFFLFFSYRNFRPPQVKFTLQKQKNSQFICRNIGKFCRTKLEGIFQAQGKGLTRDGQKKEGNY
jgi:hypothetical protein